MWLRCRRRRLSRSERRRCPRDKTRRPAGVARCAILVFSFFFSFSFPRKKEFVCVWGGGILVEIRFARVFFSAMWGRETRVIATFWFGFVGCGIGRVIFNQLWWILSFGSHRTRARNSRAYPLIFLYSDLSLFYSKTKNRRALSSSNNDKRKADLSLLLPALSTNLRLSSRHRKMTSISMTSRKRLRNSPRRMKGFA